MKSILLTLITVLSLGTIALAQAPDAIKYQVAVRDGDGNRLSSSAVGVQISILQDSASGSSVYTETFAENTSSSGILNLELGSGTTTGSFSDIDWSTGTYFVELSLDIAGGTDYSVMGATQLVSVPYSLYANRTSGSQLTTLLERTQMTDIATGAMIYCSDCGTSGELQVYNGTEWTNMVGGPVVE